MFPLRVRIRGVSDLFCNPAGKTTILYKLKLGEIVTTIPTIGEFCDVTILQKEGRHNSSVEAECSVSSFHQAHITITCTSSYLKTFKDINSHHTNHAFSNRSFSYSSTVQIAKAAASSKIKQPSSA
jgi:hypothetical protein